MSVGPGKYDDLCTEVRTQARAAGAIVIVFAGVKGYGFSAQLPPNLSGRDVAKVLRIMAAEIERDYPVPVRGSTS